MTGACTNVLLFPRECRCYLVSDACCDHYGLGQEVMKALGANHHHWESKHHTWETAAVTVSTSIHMSYFHKNSIPYTWNRHVEILILEYLN